MDEILNKVLEDLKNHYSRLSKHAAPHNTVKELDKIFSPDLSGLDKTSAKEISNILKHEKDLAREAVYNFFDNSSEIRNAGSRIHERQTERFERHSSVLKEQTTQYPEVKTLKEAYENIKSELQSGQTNPLQAFDHRKFPNLSDKDKETILSEKERQNISFYNKNAGSNSTLNVEISGKNNQRIKTSESGDKDIIEPVPRNADGQINGEKWNQKAIERIDSKLKHMEHGSERKHGMLHGKASKMLGEAFSQIDYKGDLTSGTNVNPSHEQGNRTKDKNISKKSDWQLS